jgi:inorganic pyrophosphatase
MKNITLNIGGQDRIFHFGLGFIGNLLHQSNLQMHEIDAKIQENPFKWVPEIMYQSLNYGYIRKGINADFDAFDVSEWIDDEGGFESDVVKSFFVGFVNSLNKDVPQDKTVKKKVMKK